MDKRIIRILEKTGLNKPEIEVYLSGLQTGPVLASFLARKTGTTRQHIYDILNSLEEKGLVATTGKKYNKRFIMEKPSQLKNILERRKREIEKLEKQVDVINVELESLGNEGKELPVVSFSDDIEGIRNIWEKSLDCSDKEILSILPIKDVVDLLGKDFVEYYLERRIKRDKTSRTLRVRPKEVSDDWFKLHKEQKRVVKYFPENINISSTFLVYDNVVSIISSKKENAGFTLKSEELAESMKGIFEALWTKADEG
jgi:sugar-specific transcriptional regulator TrmB